MTSVPPESEPTDPELEERRRKNREKMRRYRATHKEQVNAYDRSRYQRDIEARRAYEGTDERKAAKNARMREWRANNREMSRLQFRAWNYSLTIDRAIELLAGGCDVCGTTERLAIDHDHACCPPGRSPRSCGKCVRGAMCHGCNTAMGLLGESEERVLALLNHLRRRAAS